eukprot:TRINITY_DN2740_c0_g1_i1.p1 TRINITY_DN2740_c0_g1~~TRINITY_DN2740_c0_g1_i1.p1  ORF type:complete len:491 (+),score=106.81 TRINITY_DN2740_c0_g1_i1:215-1687(+)
MTENGATINAFGFETGAEEAAGLTELTGKAKAKALQRLRRREQKWIKMLKKWDHYTTDKHDKQRLRVFKGIPDALRGEAWFTILNIAEIESQAHLEPGELRAYQPDEKEPMFDYFETIDKDLHRTFPKHELFGEKLGLGQTEMRDMLRVFAYHHDPPGYCQGMAMVAGVLLMHQLRDKAYFSLCQLLRKDKYMLGMFDQGLPRVQMLARTLDTLIEMTWPDLHTHMEAQGIQGVIYAVDWFMCCYAKTLPWDVVLRIWDMFFLEGFKVTIRVAYEIIRLLKPRLMADCPTIQELMATLRNIPVDIAQASVLLPAVQKSKLSDATIDTALARAGYEPQADRPHPRARDPPAAKARMVAVQPQSHTPSSTLAVNPSLVENPSPATPEAALKQRDAPDVKQAVTTANGAAMEAAKLEAPQQHHMHTVDIDQVVEEIELPAEPAAIPVVKESSTPVVKEASTPVVKEASTESMAAGSRGDASSTTSSVDNVEWV